MTSSERARLLSRVAESLVTAGPESIDELIEDALARIGRLLDVDRCSLFLFNESSTELELTHAWEADGIPALPLKSMSSIPAAKLFPNTMAALLKARPLALGDTRLRDPVIGDEAGRLLQLGVRAILLVPMFGGQQAIGLIGVDRASAARAWVDAESQLLGNLGQFLTHGLLRIRAENTAREITDRYQALTEKSQSLLFEIDRDGRYTFVSGNAQALTGHRLEHLIGRSFQDFLHPEDLPELLAGFQSAMSDPETAPSLEYRVRHGDASVHWHRAVLVPLRDGAGRFRGVVGNALDITDLKQLESRLRREAALTSVLVQLATEYINLPSSDFETAIARSLRELGEFVGADRAYVFSYDFEAGIAINTHEWCATGITPQIDELQAVSLKQISDFAAAHGRGEPLQIPDLASWPHHGTREILSAQHVRSLVSVPLMLEGDCLGFVGFDYVRAARDYSAKEVHLLTVFAQMLVNMRVRAGIERQLAAERRRLGEIIDGTDAGTWEWDLQTDEMRFNHRWAEMLGVDSVDELPQTSRQWFDHVHPDDVPSAMDKLTAHLKNAQSHMEIEIRVRRADDRWLWILLRGRASQRGQDGRARLISGIAIDIQQRKAAEAELRKAASVFTHSGEGILITDLDKRIVEVNEAFTRITGYSREEILGRRPSVLSSDRHDRSFYRALWRDLLADGYWAGEIWNRRRDGTEYAQRLTISAVRDEDGKPSHYVGLFADITAQKNYQRELERMAHYDSLTGLPNRILLGDRLAQAMSQARRNGQQIAVVYIDLDNFKTINDHHGHQAGDQVLRSVGHIISAVLRETDTVARPGGDEFVAILTGLKAETQLDQLLRRMLKKFDRPIQLDEGQVKVGLSIGVTLYPQAGEPEADQLLRQADQAMFEAKRKGRNNACYFDTELERSAQRRRLDQIRLRRALAEGEFTLHYQPQIDLHSGRVKGVEALIRWQHPDRGLLAPAAFLPMIEDRALAVQFGQWVLTRALEDHERWRHHGLDLDIAVNVDAVDLLADDFPGRLRRLLATHPRFPVRRLLLEVVETSMLEDITQATAITRACQGLGVAFALDDFGTGFSSLSHLKHLPLQQLKIDRSFVFDMMSDADDLAIIEAVINLGRVFSLEVLAEGVETEEHVQALAQLGCRLVQGYRIARPMPAEEIPAWVEAWRLPEAWRRTHRLAREGRSLLFAEAELRGRAQRLDEAVRSLSTQCALIPASSTPPTLLEWVRRHAGDDDAQQLAEIVGALSAHEAALLELCRAGRQADAEVECERYRALSGQVIDRLGRLRRAGPAGDNPA